MILNPTIIALTMGSISICLVAVYSSAVGFQVIKYWDLNDGSSSQIALERKTYLISTFLNYIMAFQFILLFLFVYAADRLHTQFVGAMCAAGVFFANDYGYPTLFLKLVNAILCGVWLVLNYTDQKGFDYPIIRFKYKFLIFITSLLCLEGYLQFRYFSALQPNLITSCCGRIFSEEGNNIMNDLASIPPNWAELIFFITLLLTIRIGLYFYKTHSSALLFSWLTVLMFIISILSILSFISPYYYELPTHHCPFCLLQKDYGFVGYLFYLCLFAAAIAGSSLGLLDRFKQKESLKDLIPQIQKRLCLIAVIGYAVFGVLAAYPLIFSPFKLDT